MSYPNKRQRTELNMFGAARREHMGTLGLQRGGRGGRSAAGDTLRLNVLTSLKPTEAEILGMMLEAVNISKSGTVVRVAGGWVRDKLLGLEVRDWLALHRSRSHQLPASCLPLSTCENSMPAVP